MKKILERIKQTAWFKQIVKTLNRIVLPGFEGLSLLEVIEFMIQALKKGGIDTKAAAIAFNIFLAFFPSLIFLLSLIPFVPIDNFQEELLGDMFSIIPENLLPLVESTINDLILKKHSVVLSLGFLLTFYFASNSVNALLSAFNSSFQITNKQHPIIQRLWSLGLLSTLVFLLFVAVLTILFGEMAINWVQESTNFNGGITSFLLYSFRWIIILLLMFFSISLLYNIGNPQKVKWKLVSAGTTLTTLIIILTSAGFGYYVTNFSKFNELYGSIGSLIAFLLWIKICSHILLIGFELSAKVQSQIKE